jgi:regulator of RNase E activity RraA
MALPDSMKGNIVPDITRPDAALCDALREIGSATVAGALYNLGVTRPHMSGLPSWRPGKAVAGPALTLQCMPKRQDVTAGIEYSELGMLHHYVLYPTKPGDVVVCDARGEMEGGIFGEMLCTYFLGLGGVGMVIDGCMRDWPHVKDIDLGMWARGVSPNHGLQNRIMFWAINVPIACADVLVMPGDIIVADDDGAVVVPVKLAPEVIKQGEEKNAWEVFTRMKLHQGEDVRKYYPLNDEATVEYEAWRADPQGSATPPSAPARVRTSRPKNA